MLISNHNCFRVLFNKIASVYFIWKICLYISIRNGQHSPLCQLYRHTFFPYAIGREPSHVAYRPQKTGVKNLVKFGHMVFEICTWTEIKTYRRTYQHWHTHRNASHVRIPREVINVPRRLKACSQRMNSTELNWTDVSVPVHELQCEQPHVFRNDWASTVLVSLQPIKSWRA